MLELPCSQAYIARWYSAYKVHQRKEYTSPYLSDICDVYSLFFMSTCMQGNRPESIGDEWRTRGENSPACARVMPKPPRRLRVAFSPPADNGHARAHDRYTAPAAAKSRG